MSTFRIVSFTTRFTRAQLTELRKELTFFLGLRMWLISYCGVRYRARAEAIIQVYRQTWDPEALQIHVHQDDGNHSPSSFLISSETNNTLYDAGFLRFRYKSVEEDSSGRYTTASFKILRTWGETVRAVLVAMTTSINDKLDSSSYFLLRRDKNGDWKMFRSWQLECPTDSNAWKLGTAKLGAKNLAQWAKLGDEIRTREGLVETHEHLIANRHRHSFKFGSSCIPNSKMLHRLLMSKRREIHELGYEEFAAYIDHLLFQPTSSPTRG